MKLKELSLEIKPTIILRVIPNWFVNTWNLTNGEIRKHYSFYWLIFEITFKIRK